MMYYDYHYDDYTNGWVTHFSHVLFLASLPFKRIPSTFPSASKASSASVTTLSNGLTVVSEDASTTSTITLTYPNAGSASETLGEYGAALANKFLSFKSGSGLSSAVILRNIENDGATPFATASRTSATVGYTASKDKAIRLIPLLATDCTFEKWDVRDAQALAKVEVEEALSNAQSVLTESIYAAAFGAQSAMGKPFYATSPGSSAIASFRKRAYGLKGAVLSATGIEDHEAFVKAVEIGFSESVVGEGGMAPKSVYLGGESRVHAPSAGFAHIVLAFEGVGSSAIMNVVKKCLSSDAISGFSAPGLIGVYGGTVASDAAAMADSMVSAMTSVPSAETVEKAKALAKAEALFALDSGSQSLSKSMAASVLETGSFSAASLSAAYDSITVKDVAAVMETLAKSKPAMAAVGDLSSTPYQGSIVSKFG
jgi:predicted Zn-dependent peptidase